MAKLHHNKWGKIAKEFGNRTDNQCSRRYKLLMEAETSIVAEELTRLSNTNQPSSQDVVHPPSSSASSSSFASSSVPSSSSSSSSTYSQFTGISFSQNIAQHSQEQQNGDDLLQPEKKKKRGRPKKKN